MSANNNYYYRGRGPLRPPFAYHGGGGSFENVQPRPAYPPYQQIRQPLPLAAVDLTHRVVIPPPKNSNKDPACICERTVDYIICTGCGFLDDSRKTRKRRTCPVHPRRMLYTDLEKCPTCHGDIEEQA